MGSSGAVTSRWILLRKTRVSFVVRPDLINLDWVRLALPRSPESGVAVSTAGKILSREKRKMWMRFSQNAHILWYVFQKAGSQERLNCKPLNLR
jgi:hypothetical protein